MGPVASRSMSTSKLRGVPAFRWRIASMARTGVSWTVGRADTPAGMTSAPRLSAKRVQTPSRSSTHRVATGQYVATADTVVGRSSRGAHASNRLACRAYASTRARPLHTSPTLFGIHMTGSGRPVIAILTCALMFGLSTRTALAVQPAGKPSPAATVHTLRLPEVGPISKYAEASRLKPQVVSSCRAVDRRPHQLRWCDNSDSAIRIRWSKWGHQEALGRGIMLNNTCVPSCAEGSYERFQVTVRLHRARRAGEHRRFTRATFYNPQHGQGVYWMPLRPM
jgi:hypothetical protein